MERELIDGNQREALELAKTIKHNLQKTSIHGRRADAIVKEMLLHSRSKSDEKELVDLNALADEFLRLSYQGLRAQNKGFNATIKTDLDPEVGRVMLIRQSFGRLLLNLFNNAFYSLAEKAKKMKEGYQPTITVCTKLIPPNVHQKKMVEIRVKDNGLGISKNVLDKLFQPFFTTKPAGKGTGLGLSLSYDIVTKTHGGQITVDTKEGEFAEFIIQIPVHDT
jgi:signal transduction histidine kinase